MASDRHRDLLAPSPPPTTGESDLSLDVSARATANAAIIRTPTGSSCHRPKLPPQPRPPLSSAGTGSTFYPNSSSCGLHHWSCSEI
uniref:Uncharacterized protein n=1 Tax=Arundo donax TaxID=35708 RepID=A0A0A9GTX5_ARUDO